MKLLTHKSFFVETEVCLHILCGQAAHRIFETENSCNGFREHFYTQYSWNESELPNLLVKSIYVTFSKNASEE